MGVKLSTIILAGPRPNRSDAIRRLVEIGLKAKGKY
jgi:hypothetical protein